MAETLDRGPNDWLIDEMRARWLVDPGSVSESWATYFDGHAAAPAPTAAPTTAPNTAPTTAPTTAPPTPDEPTSRDEDEVKSEPPEGSTPLRGITATIAKRMDESLSVPTATSFRVVPAKLLEVNRLILNNQLKRLTSGGKVSFTHLIGYALVRAVRENPSLNVSYAEIDGDPHVVEHEHVNFGLAIDIERSS
ncbi:MAG: 2-oxo acid dehydrogenase subunit E2, partial [Acidimicrobiia bacterium]